MVDERAAAIDELVRLYRDHMLRGLTRGEAEQQMLAEPGKVRQMVVKSWQLFAILKEAAKSG